MADLPRPIKPALPTYQDGRRVWPATVGWVLERRRRGPLHRLMIRLSNRRGGA